MFRQVYTVDLLQKTRAIETNSLLKKKSLKHVFMCIAIVYQNIYNAYALLNPSNSSQARSMNT